jgi:glycosyltransferase involved in cell wall biosynthesis
MGYQPVNPMIIRNASDPDIFYPAMYKYRDAKSKTVLVSSSWSKNMIKGFDTYSYLDKTLDFDRFEYRFIGQSPMTFDHISLSEALPSAGLAEKLRECDIYITASRNDPASNSLLEAITCGLPVIYLNSGGHKEIAGFAGIGFDRPEEIPALIEKILADYEAYRHSLYARSIRTIVDQYLQAIQLS